MPSPHPQAADGRALDLLIAATAHHPGVPLYTRDPDDVAGLEELLDIRVV
jgi:predicted nucleic acid-binding protein